jgi:hypothetical protein
MLDMCNVQPGRRVNANGSIHAPPAEPAWSTRLFMEPARVLINREAHCTAAFVSK